MTPPEHSGRDWVLVIFIAVVGCALAVGLGLLGAAAVSMAGARSRAPGPSASTTSRPPRTTPNPTPTLGSGPPTISPDPRVIGEAACAFGDFPVYPGSSDAGDPTPTGRAWHVDAYPSQVADYYSAGVGRTEWQFRLMPASGSPWRFRMTRPPACRGVLTVMANPTGGTRYEATPDRALP